MRDVEVADVRQERHPGVCDLFQVAQVEAVELQLVVHVDKT